MRGSVRPFVGRGEQLDALASFLDGVGVGARVAYVDGPAGIGKTSLIDAVAENWRDAGGEVRSSRCWNGPGTPPLWPWMQIVGDLESPDATQGARGQTSEGGGSVEWQSGARSAELARFEKFAGVVTSLLARPGSAPLLIVIDDLHWADVATIDLLDFIMHDARASEIRVVVTARTPEADLLSDMPLLAEVANHAYRVTLTGLALDDVVRLAREFAAPDSVAASVFERTGGNPLYVTELLRLGRSEADIEIDDAVPSSIGATIRRHLDVLGPETQRVMQLAAVQGQMLDVEVVAAAGQLDRDELDVMLRLAQRYHLVQRRGDRWMFVHALVGDALLDSVAPDQASADHLATADAIEKVHGTDRDDRSGMICAHLVWSGTQCPAQRLVDTARSAARHAASQLAWTSQAEFLTVAIEAHRRANGDHHELVDLLIEKCQAEKSARLIEAATATATELARLVRSMDDPIALARAALVYPPDSEGIEIDEIHDPEQLRIRTEALHALPAGETELRIQLQASLALSLYWETATGDRAESHHRSAAQRDDLTRSAVSEARELGDPAVLAVALDARIHATWGPTTVRERPRLARELYEVALVTGDSRRALAARVWKIAELLETDRLGEADREIATFEADALRINDRVGMWTVLRWRSNRAFMSGDLDAAERSAGEALGVALEFLPEHVSMSFYVTMLGPIHYVQGSLGADLEAIQMFADESSDVPAWQVGVATAMSELGQLDGARRRLRRLAADDFAVLPRDLNFFGAMIMLSLTSLNVGDAEVAAAIRPHLEARAGRYAVHGTGYTSYGPVDLSLAQCAHTSGDVVAAEHHYLVAIELGDRVGTPYADVARLHLGLLLMASDPDRARAVLIEAFERFDHRGFGEMAGRAAALLFELDERRTVAIRDHDGRWALHPHSRERLDVGALKGMRALRELLLHPHTAFHALSLTRVIERDTLHAVDVHELEIERADDRALRAYRARVDELHASLAEADRRGDDRRSGALQTELDALLDHLASTQGLRGRAAHDATSADRARVNITKHLKRSVERIARLDAELGEHLRIAVSTGMYCVYEPPAGVGYRFTT